MPKSGAAVGLEARGLGPALLPRNVYLDAPDVVARKLLGKLLVRPAEAAQSPALVGRIVEVEAYFGSADPSAHAFAGKTARNAVLFGPPGHAYVYFIYGMHSCLNVSCEPEGEAGCVLIRALEPLAGLKTMVKRRWPGKILPGVDETALESQLRSTLASGPGRLCQAFAVTRAQNNGADFTSPLSSLQIQDDGFLPGEVVVTPRIGISKAADRLARFLLAGNSHVSRTPLKHFQRRLPSRFPSGMTEKKVVS